MRSVRVSLLLALFLLATAAGISSGNGEGEPGQLLAPAPAPEGMSDGALTAEDATRRRYVSVDLAVLGAGSKPGFDDKRPVRIDLFDGSSYTAVTDDIERPAAGRIIWRGWLEGQPEGGVTIVARDGVAAGSIRANDRLYRLVYAGDGVHALEEMGQTEPMSEHPPIAVETPQTDGIGSQSTSGDDGSVMDVLVVYTAASRQRYGGEPGIEALIDLAVAETNQAYAASQINSRLALVATAEVSYSESGSMSQDLYRLRDKNDGYLESVHDWRDTYAADMVSMIEEATDYCGIAFLMTNLSNAFEDDAFSVIHSSCATGYYSFGHELGHNMGSFHNHEEEGSGLFPYSFGFWAADRSFRTIMAYNCPLGCVRVQRFSNPDVLYNGQPTGVPYQGNPSTAANNARSINEASFTVANWRDSSTRSLLAPTNLTAVAQSPTQVKLSWQDNNNGELGFEVQRRKLGQTWVMIADLPGNSTGYVDPGRSADTTYEYRVRSYDSSLTSNFSNLARVTTPRYPEVHLGAVTGVGIVESNPSWGVFSWRASASILVHGAYHGPVSGAVVSGIWGGGASGSDSCTTDSQGLCTVSRPGLSSAVESVTFSVTGISKGSAPYLPDHNHAGGATATAHRPKQAHYLPLLPRNS